MERHKLLPASVFLAFTALASAVMGLSIRSYITDSQLPAPVVTPEADLSPTQQITRLVNNYCRTTRCSSQHQQEFQSIIKAGDDKSSDRIFSFSGDDFSINVNFDLLERFGRLDKAEDIKAFYKIMAANDILESDLVIPAEAILRNGILLKDICYNGFILMYNLGVYNNDSNKMIDYPVSFYQLHDATANLTAEVVYRQNHRAESRYLTADEIMEQLVTERTDLEKKADARRLRQVGPQNLAMAFVTSQLTNVNIDHKQLVEARRHSRLLALTEALMGNANEQNMVMEDEVLQKIYEGKILTIREAYYELNKDGFSIALK